jgi:DNA primase
MFNVVDLHTNSRIIAICEGELDTLIMSALVGVPAVGVAGVSQWKPHFPKMFEGFDRVVIFADNDIKEDGRNPGMELAKRIKEDIDDAVVIQLPDNKDVNQVFLEEGKEWLYERAMG